MYYHNGNNQTTWSSWVVTGSATTTDITWRNWVDTSSTSASTYPYTITTTATAANATWLQWNSNITTGVSATYHQTTPVIWDTWVNNTPRTRIQHINTYPRETEEQRRARIAQFELEDKKRKEIRALAIEKADALLQSVLNDAQKIQLKEKDWFLVRSQSGKLYRIRNARHINVDLVNEKTGEIIRTYCAHPRMDVPNGDTLVGQKLMLQFEEEEFIKIANKHSAFQMPVKMEDIVAMS